MTFEIGSRQTVCRALHPTAGEGRAVYTNGPAFFLPDDGEPIPMRSIGFGGASSSPRRSWLVAYTVGGERVELETTGRHGGDVHRRMWSPIFGAGWVVFEAGQPWRDGMSPAEKEPPRPKPGKAPSPARVEWDRWTTWGGYEFRDEPPTEHATLPGVL